MSDCAAARENRASRDGFGGIGVRIRVIDEGVKILSIMEKTPAERSGLMVEDVITDIDGVNAVGLSQRDVVRRLRGPIRSKVNLLVQRSTHDAKLPISVTRALVVPQTVEFRTDDNIGYVRVSNFNQGTARSLREKLKLARDGRRGDTTLGYSTRLLSTGSSPELAEGSRSTLSSQPKGLSQAAVQCSAVGLF